MLLCSFALLIGVQILFTAFQFLEPRDLTLAIATMGSLESAEPRYMGFEPEQSAAARLVCRTLQSSLG